MRSSPIIDYVGVCANEANLESRRLVWKHSAASASILFRTDFCTFVFFTLRHAGISQSAAGRVTFQPVWRAPPRHVTPRHKKSRPKSMYYSSPSACL
ncbi:hypothetical protein V9T40_009886 [Parthenolecanium corni]|uniref:Uncharacterized protein n=1 Tax=Parthenolecanium corni TaxID=536013 RepID=A0AAN9TMN6_9HEMI